jgi:hypothetical protein
VELEVSKRHLALRIKAAQRCLAFSDGAVKSEWNIAKARLSREMQRGRDGSAATVEKG